MADDPVICLGRVFRNAEPTDDPHPNIIASNPIADPERIVVVNVSSYPTVGDTQSYTLEKGEHPMISHTSYIRCEDSALLTLGELQERVSRGKILPSRVLSDRSLQKVQRALDESRRARREVQAVIRAQGVVKIKKS